MKRFSAIMAATSLFAAVPIMPSPAFAADSPGNTELVDHCQTTTGFPEETTGNCIAVQTTAHLYFSGTGGAGFIAQICSFFQKSFPDQFYAAYDSYDECILDGASNL